MEIKKCNIDILNRKQGMFLLQLLLMLIILWACGSICDMAAQIRSRALAKTPFS